MHHFMDHKTGNSQLFDHHNCHQNHRPDLVVKGKTSTGETQHLIKGQQQTRDLNADEQTDLILDLLYVEECSMGWAVVGW